MIRIMDLQQILYGTLAVIHVLFSQTWAIEEITSEVCELETFTARCPYTQEILITKALYGHIKKGKCIHLDLGYFGCFARVDAILDGRCGGKQRCEITMPDEEIKDTNPCPAGLGTYLEASYACIPDIASDVSCTGITVSRRLLHITSKQLHQLDCSGEDRSYLIFRAEKDLKIKLMVESITKQASNETTHGFIEYGNGENMTISISTDKKNAEIVIPGNTAKVWLTHRDMILVIGVQAVGCENLLPPPYTWMRRDGAVTTIGCDHTKHTWQLRCIGTKWVGTLGNCTKPPVITEAPRVEEPKETHVEGKRNPFSSREILYALIIGVTLFLCVIVVTVGYVFLKRAMYLAKAQASVNSTEMQNMVFTDGNYSNTDSWIRDTCAKPINTNTLQPTLLRPQNGNLTTKSQKYYIVDQDYVNAAGASQA